MASRLEAAANVLVRHPAYLYSRIKPMYLRYEAARLTILQRRRVDPAFCMGLFFMHLDPRDRSTGVSADILLRGGFYEPESTAVFRRLLRKGDTVVDIGANLGWYTLLAARTVGPTGMVVACEPEPHNFELLQASVRLNHLPNVKLVEKCVADGTGQLSLALSDTNAGGHTIVAVASGSREIRVESTTLDDLSAQLGLKRIDVMKIDAEGAEPLIMYGASALLSQGQPRHIVMEYTPKAWVEHQGLLSYMFREFDVFEIYRSLVKRTSPSRLPKGRQAMLLLSRRRERRR